jgi:signal transduction histidine kinase
MANAPRLAEAFATAYSDPAVAAVGWLDGDRLVWPWDIPDATTRGPAEDPDFARLRAEARRAEFTEKHPDHAAELYRRATEAARTAGDRAAADLQLARALARSGAQASAIAAYRQVLKSSSTVLDDYGIPWWSYAVEPLVQLHAAGGDVLERVMQEAQSPRGMAPFSLSRYKAILETLKTEGDPAMRQDASAALNRLTPRIDDMEEAQSLQKDFPRLRVTSADWQPYESKELWLVGQAPSGASRPIVLAVRAEAVRASVESVRLARKAGPHFQIAAAAAPGDSASEHLPGFRLSLASGEIPISANTRNSQLSLWELSFALVLTLTFLGGFLLWRDTRREVHVAELRTQFVSSVSHELKTPLTSIRMFAEILQMKDPPDTQVLREYLEIILNESERLTRLLNNVLDFSRIERGQKSYSLKSATLSDVVQDAVRTIQYPLSEQGFVLKLTIASGIPPVVIDRDAIQQAILNLLTNAMKYSGQSREIELSLAADKGSAVIEVTDHGIGIPEKEQARIFEKFYRAAVPENQAISGTGLGLALVAHIAEAHAGSVGVKSSPGQGSTFSIRIPLASGPGTHPSQQTLEAASRIV